jgi:hypothetical protein
MRCSYGTADRQPKISVVVEGKGGKSWLRGKVERIKARPRLEMGACVNGSDLSGLTIFMIPWLAGLYLNLA